MNWLTILTGLAPLIAPGIESLVGVLGPTIEVPLIKLVQTALNEAQAAGVISFGAPLAIDGSLGPLTQAAINAAITKI